MKKFIVTVALLIVTQFASAAEYTAANSKVISTAETALLVVRNPSTSTKTVFVESIRVCTDLKCTFFIYANPGAPITGSSTVAIGSTNVGTISSINTNAICSTATAGNTTATGTLLYSVTLGAGADQEIPLKHFRIPAGYGIYISGVASAATTTAGVSVTIRE